MTLTNNRLNRSPGELDEYRYRDDFHFDSTSGFLGSNDNSTEFLTPSIAPGEVWELRFNITFSNEMGSGDQLVVSLQNEAQDETLYETILGDGDGEHVELAGIVTREMNGADGANSPDLLIQTVGDTGGNYFIRCIGIRIRAPSDTSTYTAGEGAETRSGTNFNAN